MLSTTRSRSAPRARLGISHCEISVGRSTVNMKPECRMQGQSDMKTSILSLSLCGLASCAGTQQPAGPMAPSGSVPGVMDEVRPPPEATSQFTSRADCDKLVDHLDSVLSLSGRVSLFRARNQTAGFHRSLVDECTITVDHYDRDCLF